MTVLWVEDKGEEGRGRNEDDGSKEIMFFFFQRLSSLICSKEIAPSFMYF